MSTGVNLDTIGDLEVLAGNTAYRSDGTIFWQYGTSDGASAVGNYDSDGYPEVVFVSNGTIYLLDNVETDSLSLISSLQFSNRGSNYPGVFPALGQFDSLPEPEVAVTDGDTLMGIDFTGGSWIIKWKLDVNDFSSRSGVSVADLDGDNIDEVIFRDHDTLWIVDGETGAVEWKEVIRHPTMYEYPVAADIDGDNRMEVVVAGSDQSHRGVSAFECLTWMDGRRVWNDYTYHVTNINEDGTVPQFQEPSWLTNNSFLAQEKHPPSGFGVFGPWTIEIVKYGITGPYNAITLRKVSKDFSHPYISFYNDSTGPKGLWYATKDSCPPDTTPPFQWKEVTPIDTTNGRGVWTSIAVSTITGVPYVWIGYTDSLLWDVRGMEFSFCDTIPKTQRLVDSVGTLGSFGSDIAVTPNDSSICIVFYDATNRNLKYAERALVASDWDTTTVDATGDVGRYPAIAIDASGIRHVSYYDTTNGDLKYATCPNNCTDPNSWNGIGSKIVVDSTSDVGLFTEIAVDTFGTPHISYINATNQSLKYAFNVGGWDTVTVDSPNNLVASTSIAVRGVSTGMTRHISYSSRTNQTLKYANCSGGYFDCNQTIDWVTVTVPDPWDDVGLWNSIAVSDSDTVHISYTAIDAHCGFMALKYAKGKP
jgi:hypothetical protein